MGSGKGTETFHAFLSRHREVVLHIQQSYSKGISQEIGAIAVDTPKQKDNTLQKITQSHLNAWPENPSVHHYHLPSTPEMPASSGLFFVSLHSPWALALTRTEGIFS